MSMSPKRDTEGDPLEVKSGREGGSDPLQKPHWIKGIQRNQRWRYVHIHCRREGSTVNVPGSISLRLQSPLYGFKEIFAPCTPWHVTPPQFAKGDFLSRAALASPLGPVGSFLAYLFVAD